MGADAPHGPLVTVSGVEAREAAGTMYPAAGSMLTVERMCAERGAGGGDGEGMVVVAHRRVHVEREDAGGEEGVWTRVCSFLFGGAREGRALLVASPAVRTRRAGFGCWIVGILLWLVTGVLGGIRT